MRYPTLGVRPSERKSITRFRGLNRNPRPQAGEFSDMKNLSSDAYPVLSPRLRRGIYRRPASPQGLIARDKLCYVDGADFVMGDTRIPMGLSVDPADCPKRLQSMGAYVIILPDKKYINTARPEDFGDIEAVSQTQGVKFTLCRENGGAYGAVHSGAQAPEAPENGALWMDTGASPPLLMQYSAPQAQWVQIATTYVKLEAPGIGRGFAAFDGVTIRGAEDPAFNGSFVLWDAQEDAVVIEGILDAAFTQESPLILERRMPELQYITESGNRLWGCHYGLDSGGNPVNEIYACKLGDFKNWSCYQGLSTDSFTASCGTAGPFTGAATHMGYPLFFKEDCLHKVYGTEPASYRVQTTPCRGVQIGCGGSLAQVGEQLIYRSRGGICAYDGAISTLISRNLGKDSCQKAEAGAVGDKYYISQVSGDGSTSLLVWDSARNLWHKEDDLLCSAFCRLGSELFVIDGRSRNILGLLGTGEPEREVQWMAQTGELGLEGPQRKHISRLTLDLALESGSRLEVLAQYDDEENWEQLCVVFSGNLRTIRLPLRPRRCGYLKLRLQGSGPARVYSITRITEEGSDQV